MVPCFLKFPYYVPMYVLCLSFYLNLLFTCLPCPYLGQFCFSSQQFPLSGLLPWNGTLPGRSVLRVHRALIAAAPFRPSCQAFAFNCSWSRNPPSFNCCSVCPVVLSSDYLLAPLGLSCSGSLECLIASPCFLPGTCWLHVGLVTGESLSYLIVFGELWEYLVTWFCCKCCPWCLVALFTLGIGD